MPLVQWDHFDMVTYVNLISHNLIHNLSFLLRLSIIQ